QACAERVEGRLRLLPLRVELEDAEDLREPVALARSGALELLGDPDECTRLAVLQLDLDLDEAAVDALRVHDRDLRRRLVAVDERAVPPGAELGDRSDGGLPLVGADERAEPLRRACGPTGLLELDPRAVDRDLQLPEAAPALGPPPERDP